MQLRVLFRKTLNSLSKEVIKLFSSNKRKAIKLLMNFCLFMLGIVGLGITGIELSLQALSFVKSCDKVYAENYTGVINNVVELENLLGKKIILLPREQVEEEMPFINDAKSRNTAFLVLGDPLVATTHFEILSRAKSKGVSYHVFHSSSVISGVSITGLSIYKFGKIASIPKPKPSVGFKPTSFYDLIKENQSIKAHTLCLLDTEPVPLKANEALRILLDIENEKKKKLISHNSLIIVIARLGSDNELIKYGRVSNLLSFDFGSPPHCIIIPSELNFKEKEFLEAFYK